MSGAPKASCTLWCLLGERALLGKDPFGEPQETITQPIKHLVVPTAAVPALASMAAVVCLAPQAQADPAPAHAAAQPAAVTQAATVADAISHSGMSPAELLLRAAGQRAGGPSRQLHRPVG